MKVTHLKNIISIFLFLSFTSCSEQLSLIPETKVVLRSMSMSASQDMNNQMVVTLHLVVPKVQGLYDEILKMDSLAYFAASEQMKIDYTNDLEIMVWEIIPGTSLEKEKIRLKDYRGVGCFVFAKYDDSIPGAHRIVLPKQKKIRILLKRNDLMLGE